MYYKRSFLFEEIAEFQLLCFQGRFIKLFLRVLRMNWCCQRRIHHGIQSLLNLFDHMYLTPLNAFIILIIIIFIYVRTRIKELNNYDMD